jgi:hydroxymethylpyrimidine kinase/phosphomethylpyrimidine kinase/thiamine-phosphate diphosphorylase
MTHQTAPHSASAVVWSVAGSDSGGGAGLQADLRAIEAFGAHACTVVAAITAQNSVAVQHIEPVSPTLLEAQLTALASDLPPAAIKTGMLGSAENLQLLAYWIDRLRQQHPALPLVVDPVLRASTGAVLADQALLHGYRTALLPRATLISPNRSEAAALLGGAALHSRHDVEQAASALLALGCKAVVITGGDEAGDRSEDYAATPQASGWLSLPRVVTPHHHGTGCVLAASMAAAMARGFVEIEAIILAKMATTHALRHGYGAGRGAGPVHPGARFALAHENLPTLRMAGQAWGSAFAKLSEPDLGLYAIVGSAVWVQRVLDAGVRTVQLRIKDSKHPSLRHEVRASIAAAKAVNAQLFINDHWALAIEEGAYGVHLGQEDLERADLDAIARAGLRLGLSTHSYWEVCRAWALQPSYIACGPIHPTRAKRMPWIVQGNDNLAYWCALLPLPVVAIAGMDGPRAAQAMQCGAAGVAVISAITGALSPEAEIARLAQALQAGRLLPRRASPELPRSTLQRAC